MKTEKSRFCTEKKKKKKKEKEKRKRTENVKSKKKSFMVSNALSSNERIIDCF